MWRTRCHRRSKIPAHSRLMYISSKLQRHPQNPLIFYHLFTHDPCQWAPQMIYQPNFGSQIQEFEQSCIITLKHLDDSSLDMEAERTMYVKMSSCRYDHDGRFADTYGISHTKRSDIDNSAKKAQCTITLLRPYPARIKDACCDPGLMNKFNTHTLLITKYWLIFVIVTHIDAMQILAAKVDIGQNLQSTNMT